MHCVQCGTALGETQPQAQQPPAAPPEQQAPPPQQPPPPQQQQYQQPPPGYGQQPPPGYGQQPYYGHPPGPQMDFSWITGLFDFSFRQFSVESLAKVTYIAAIVYLLLDWIFDLINAFDFSAGMGVKILLVGLLGIIVQIFLLRVVLEGAVMIYKLYMKSKE